MPIASQVDKRKQVRECRDEVGEVVHFWSFERPMAGEPMRARVDRCFGFLEVLCIGFPFVTLSVKV